mgnify:FL=1
MQARGGRGGGMLLAHGVHGLVLLGISLIAGDVGRQRHVARGVNRLIQRALNPLLVHAHGLEAHQASALGIVHEIDDLGGEHDGRALRREEAALAILDHVAGLEALAGVHQALPHMTERVDVLAATKQQRLGHTARGLLPIRRAGMTRV